MQGYSVADMFFDVVQSSFGFSEKAGRLAMEDVSFFHLHGVPTTYFKGSPIFRQGSTVRGVHLLVEGKAKVFRELIPGQRQIFHFHRQGDLMGCRHLFNDEKYPFQAEAIEDCQTIFIPADPFLKHAAKSLTFTQYLLEQQSREFSAWTNNLSMIARHSVKTRLSISLLNLHEIFKLPGNPTAVICLSRTDLANYAGTSLETTVRMLREMKNAGLLHFKGRRIVLLDLMAMARVSREMSFRKVEA
jgi:CRP-like cAMP-binding protein